ncbi:MAG: CPBP family glutamic-type intramembrane protease, partial [Lysobacter sp.]
LGSPLLQGWLDRRTTPELPSLKPRMLKPLHTVALGVLTAIAILGASALLDPLLPKPLHPIADPGAGSSALNGLFASFYGGIAEELQLRLFLMTLLVWLFAGFGRRQPHSAMFWIAIAIAALAFGAGHLPAAEKVWGLDAIVVLRTIGLNAVGGVVFGWLYWKRGIEMAMLGHFSADIVLHALSPLLATVATT